MEDFTTQSSPAVPAEFLPFAQDPSSLTARTARHLGVDPLLFLNWRWQMQKQIRTAQEAEKYLALSQEELAGFADLKGLFNVGLTPYYGGLIAFAEQDRSAVRLQALPRGEEKFDRLGVADPLGEVSHSPVREVVHVYPDRVAFCVAMLCPVYCRYCYRKRRDDEEGLHFNRQIIARGLEYIASNTAIRDVLITGGDPFIASDTALVSLLEKLRAIPHIEVVRFGTRTPVTLPYRVTRELAQKLSQFHPLWLNTHFNSVAELTPEACQALRNLVDAGIPVGNQTVLLKGVNDSPEQMLALCRKLIANRVRPYYVFHAHMVAGTEHLRVPVHRGLEIMKSLRGKISGFGIPSYILDTPSGKVPLGHNHILGQDGDDLLIENLHGEIWREVAAMH